MSTSKEDNTDSVCFFNTNMEWGGGEKWSLTVANEMKKKGYNVIMITLIGSELHKRSLEAGLKTNGLKIKTISFLNPFLMWHIKNIYRNDNVRVVFLNLSIDLKTGGRVARNTGVPVIIYRRGMARPIRGTRFNRYLLARVVTKIIATSDDTKQGILQNFRGVLDPEKISVIYNGVELPERKQDERGREKIVIGSAGRISIEKGYISLVELGRKLTAMGIDFEIVLAGKGDQLSYIKNEVAKEGIESKFRFPGFMHDMDKFYRSIDIFVLTSEKEGFANVVLESMSYGKPVIAFNIGSPSEIIIHGMNGFIVGENNIEEMAVRISEFYNKPGMIKKMGERARERIKEDFSLERHIEKIEDIIK